MNNKRHFAARPFLLGLALLSSVPFAFAEVGQERLDKISETMQAAVDNGKLAGTVSLLAQDGETELFEAYGHRDLENDVPMTKDTIFRIFSMTKPVVGTGLMVLHDEGKFELDEPVAKYIPEFKDMRVANGQDAEGNFETVPADHPMTIRELMSHTGGLVYTPRLSSGPVAEAYAEAGILDRDTTLEEMARSLGEIPLNHQPGTQWVYSISVDVQGYLIEVLSGQTLDVFLKERIFDPLGMADTAFYVAEDKAERLSRSYAPGQGKLMSRPNSEFLQKPDFLSGGGGLTSTASDYLKFAQMHLNEGELDGTRILSEEAAELMRENHLPEGVENIGPFYPGNVFGLDFAVVNDSEAAGGLPEGTFWWWGIAGTWVWIDPVQDIVFIGMIQNADLMYSRQLQAQVKQALYGM